MTKTIEVIYEKGVFKPLEPVKMKEGEKMRIELGEVIKDPLEIALKGKKFAKMKDEEVERICLREQMRYESSA